MPLEIWLKKHYVYVKVSFLFDNGCMHYTIRNLAEEFDLTPRTLRHYEELGLISPKRDKTNRMYSKKDHARLVLICRGKRLGFSLEEIKEFLDLYDVKDHQVNQMSYLREKCTNQLARLEIQKADLDQTLSELKDIKQKIEHYLKKNEI